MELGCGDERLSCDAMSIDAAEICRRCSRTEPVNAETMRKLLKTMGLDSTPEGVSKLTKQMETTKQQAGAMNITTTETFERIAVNDLMIKEDFEVTVPAAGTVPNPKKP